MSKYRVFVNDTEQTVHSARVSARPINKIWAGEQRPFEQSEEAYFVSFDMAEPVTLSVEVSEPFDKYELRPLSREFNECKENNRFTLTIKEPMQFTLELDGTHHALHIFANPVSEKPEGDVIYFGPGTHKADLIWLESNQTLYIDEGAVVYGVVYAMNAQNVRIMGRGILDASPYRRGNDDSEGGREIINALLERGFSRDDMRYHGNVVLNHCKNCLIEGLILRDAPMWSTIIRNESENITVDNIKIIGQWRYNSDGINVCTSKNIMVKNCFVRSFDDCIITRGAYLEGEDGNVENVTVENCVFWCDWGKVMETWCGQKPTEIKHIRFKNNAIIHMNHVAMNITVWYGCDHSVVNDVTYENIAIDMDRNNGINYLERERFVEEIKYTPQIVRVSVEFLGRMLGLGTQHFEPATDDSGFSVYFGNISYKNVKYYGAPCDTEVLVKKYSDIHTIEHVTAENCDFDIEGWD